MPEPEQRGKTLRDCADNLERLSMIIQDLGLAVAEHYPGISLTIGDCADEIKKEASFLREY